MIKTGRINPGMRRNEAVAETRAEKQEEDERRILGTVPVEGKYRSLIIDPP